MILSFFASFFYNPKVSIIQRRFLCSLAQFSEKIIKDEMVDWHFDIDYTNNI